MVTNVREALGKKRAMFLLSETGKIDDPVPRYRSTMEALIDNRHSLFENPRTKSICRAKMPANRAAGVAIAMEQCSDLRQ